MRYGYDGVYERQGLGVKQAFAVAFFYTGTMAGCALARSTPRGAHENL